MRYLLDTNVLVEGSRATPNASVLRRFAMHGAALHTAAPVLHELHFGVMRMSQGRRRRQLTAYYERLFASSIEVLPYDAEAAQWHASQRARLTADGRTPAFVDGQIAAIAATNALTLVTRNADDFRYFRDLGVENWFE